MTADQLAQLRAIAEQYTANAVRIDYREREIALAALPRLLEERETLLAELREAAETIHSEFCGGTYHVPACESATAAIAKAGS